MTPRAAKARKAPTCQSAFQQIARQCVASVRRHHAAACLGNPEAIHQIRIALTKLHAARKFFATMTRDAAWPKLKEELGWLNEALGAARDSDVATNYAKAQHKRTLAVMDGELLARETMQTHRRLTSVLRTKRCDQLLAGLEHWIDAGPWLKEAGVEAKQRRGQLLADYAPDRLQRWKRRLARDAAEGMKREKRRHQVRIDAKRYRYMHEALVGIGMKDDRSGLQQREAAHSVQSALGDLRDLQRFRKIQPDSMSPDFYRKQKKRLLQKTRDAFRRLAWSAPQRWRT